MFRVYCNGKSADETGFPELVDCRYGKWPLSRNTHSTFNKAKLYLSHWLGGRGWVKHLARFKLGQTITLVGTKYTIEEIDDQATA